MIVSDIDPAEWDRFVQGHPDRTTYHRWDWRTVFTDVFGHRCRYLATREDGDLTGVLPLVVVRSLLFGRFAVSLPFVNYGGVLATTPGAERQLIESAVDLARTEQLSHVELRHRRRVDESRPVKEHKVAMRLSLEASADRMWQRFDKKVRNQIRKAEKSGLTIETGGSELVGAFYGVFAHNMRDLGTPVYPRALFDTVFRLFPDATRVHLVRAGSTPIAAGISHGFGRAVEVPWASSLREHLPLCPNHLVYWSAIRQAIEGGYTTFDFGRSTPGEGTYRFKQQWGAEAFPMFWEYGLVSRSRLPDHSPKNPKLQLAIAVWKRLPLGFATWLGPHVVRGIP